MQYNEKLDAALAALKGDMVETLQRWVRVPSVRAERSAENAPFGADVRRALDTAMADLKRLGFEPRDVDGYCCDTEIGSGDDVVAVLAHLDVVPEGDGWTHDPYGAEIIDGRMIGRGTSDDKGPGVAALFGMKAIMDAGIPLRRRCRLILGCDEECGMEDLKYYEKKVGLPDMGFSPDANLSIPKRASCSSLSMRRWQIIVCLKSHPERAATSFRIWRRRCWRATGAKRLPMRLMSMTRIASWKPNWWTETPAWR